MKPLVELKSFHFSKRFGEGYTNIWPNSISVLLYFHVWTKFCNEGLSFFSGSSVGNSLYSENLMALTLFKK